MNEYNPVTGEYDWSLDVLKRAREAVIAYHYAPGAEELIRKGECDHWHAMQVACFAISGKTPEPVKEAINKIDPRQRRVDIDSKIWLIEQEIEQKFKEQDERMKEICAHVDKRYNSLMRGRF